MGKTKTRIAKNKSDLTQRCASNWALIFHGQRDTAGCQEANATGRKGWGLPVYRGLPLRERLQFEWWSLRLFPQTLVTEVCMFPRRIAAILGDEILRRGGHSAPWIGGGFAALYACNSSILQLREKYPWVTSLDLELAAEAFRRGARWAEGSTDSGETSTTLERDQRRA
jgi:hypothetical protein